MISMASVGVLTLAACSSTIAGRPEPGTWSASSVPSAILAPPESVGPTEPGPRTSAGPSLTAPTSVPSATVAPLPVDLPAPNGMIGPASFGDPYYPNAGNSGYQVDHYRLEITYTPADKLLQGTAALKIVVTAPEKLGRFSFDLQPTMKVDKVWLDGLISPFAQVDNKLVVQPNEGLDVGRTTTVKVAYRGNPTTIAGGTSGLGDGGWYHTRSGGAVAVGQPFSASAWYPVNEHPADIATYDIQIDVPTEWNAIASGTKTEPEHTGPPNFNRVRYEQKSPVSSYLSAVWIDKFVESRKQVGELDVHSAYLKSDTRGAQMAELTVPVITSLTKYFGPYPYPSAGGIFTGESIPFALETAARPVYANWVDEDTVVHELAHQWYGDAVPIVAWRDICLNECMASYAPWLWAEEHGASLKDQWIRLFTYFSDTRSWDNPLVEMGAGREFSAVYERGPLAMHVLRTQMGDDAFFTLTRSWPAQQAGKPSTWEEFEALATKVAGRDMSRVFAVWFRGTAVPAQDDIPAALR